MVEYLPWAAGGVVIGLFLGYHIGKFKCASEMTDELEAESESASAESANSSSDATEHSTEAVFVRRGGSHYHREGCSHLRRRGGEAVTKAEARKKHYRRCPSCRP
jgi:hypothetical protein